MAIRIYEESKSQSSNVNSPEFSIHHGKKYQLYRTDQQKASHTFSALKAFGKSILVVASFGLGLINRKFRESYFSDCLAIFTGSRRVNRYSLSTTLSPSDKEIVSKAQERLKINPQTKTPAPTIASPRGNFANAGATSFLSIALQYVDALLLTLPTFPKLEDLRKRDDETIEDFNERKQVAAEVLNLYAKINSGQNCSATEIARAKKVLYEFAPGNITSPDPRVAGNVYDASECLNDIFYPILSSQWQEFGTTSFGTRYIDNEPNLGRAALFRYVLSKFNPETLSIGARDVTYKVSEALPGPSFLSFHIQNLDPKYKEQLPLTLEIVDAAKNGDKARYEISGIVTAGNPHVFYGKENDNWICYRTDTADTYIASEEEVEQLLRLQTARLIQYHKV